METAEEFKKNFDKVYYGEIIPAIRPLENERKTALAKCILFSVLCTIVTIPTLYLFFFSDAMFLNLSAKTLGDILFIPLLIAIVLGLIPFNIAKNFENKIKNKIMPTLLKGLKYFYWSEYESMLTDTEINATQLYGAFNRRYDDDLFEGEYKGVKISICETAIGLETGSGKNRTYTQRFKGVFVELNVDKNYKGHTNIKSHQLINLKPKDFEEVILEDVEFQKKYKVYSTDQIEARYVLTTAFIERFKNLGFAFKASKTEASINGNKIIIALSCNYDLFKVAKVTKTICDYEQFKSMAYEFASILLLIETLKLDEKIGL